MADTFPIEEIYIEDRHRKNLGDIDALAASIRDIGLLHPIVVSPKGRLIAGERRLAAVKQLGWTEVPVNVATNLTDLYDWLKAERDENACREDFTPSEAVDIGREIGKIERALAQNRQGTRTDLEDRLLSGDSPESNLSYGDTRDKIASIVGMSSFTFSRAKAVVEAAEAEPEKYGPLVEEMDKTGRVNGAYKKLRIAQQAEEIEQEPPPLPDGPFRVIVVDPPWAYDNRASDPSHRAANPYPSMNLAEILQLPISNLAADDAILWLWTTNAHLPVAFDVIEAWGFEYKTVLTWVKDRMGTGDWLRGKTEHCLMAVRGRPLVTLTNQTTIIHGPLREHSRKPDEFYELVEALCPGSKVELFARQSRDGWNSHGNDTMLFGGNDEQPETNNGQGY